MDDLAKLLVLHVGNKLDEAIERIVFGHKRVTRKWSKDEAAAHAIYEPLAKLMSWKLLFEQSGQHRGWQVRTQGDELVAKGEGQAVLAMVRAVLVYHLRIKNDDGSKKPYILDSGKGAYAYVATTITTTGRR